MFFTDEPLHIRAKTKKKQRNKKIYATEEVEQIQAPLEELPPIDSRVIYSPDHPEPGDLLDETAPNPLNQTVPNHLDQTALDHLEQTVPNQLD